jgi:hypothetical protein
MRSALITLTLALAAALAPAAAQAAPADQAFALRGSDLVTFDPAAPATSATTTAITGVAAGETLVGLDVRAANGMVYAFGVNAMSNAGTLYVLGTRTGLAKPVGGTTGVVQFTTDGATTVDLPDPSVADYGVAANPAAGVVRVTTSTGLSFRVNVTTGVPTDGNNGTGSATGTNPDEPVNGAAAGAGGVAYTNSGAGAATVTTLYAIDASTDALTIQNPPNSGTQVAVATLKREGTPLAVARVNGFDLDPAVAAPANNTAVAGGDGYAILTVGGVTHLYKIALTTGAATDLGPIGTGGATFRGLALQHEVADGGFPAIALNSGGTSLRRLMTGSPGAGTDIAVSNLNLGEVLVGLAWRPATGQLLGLGIDADNDTGTLYAIDPHTGAAAVIGGAGDISFPSRDFPPAAAGWGIDVVPTVDRVRVVAGFGINFRVNPDNGLPAALDAPHSGLPLGATGVSAVAYTNAYTQAPGGVTTAYVLEPTSNQLLIQNPPNAGTLTAGRTVTLGGAPLDFAITGGLDIPSEVAVSTANEPATGEAIAALVVGGTPGLYRIDLATGAATALGATPGVLAALAVGEARRRPIGPSAPPSPPSAPPAPPAGGAQPPVAAPPPAADRTAPRVTKLSVKAKARKRLTIAFTSSEAGKATIALQSVAKGRRQGTSCVKGRRTGKRCTLFKTYKTLTRDVKSGKATISLTGRTGAVRVLVTVTDAAKNRSKAATKTATVKR